MLRAALTLLLILHACLGCNGNPEVAKRMSRATPLVSQPDTPPSPKTQLLGHKGKVSNLAFTSDGEWLISASYGDYTLRVWDIENARETQLMRTRKRPMDIALATDDSELYFVNANGAILIYPFEGGQIVDDPVELGETGRHAHLAASTDSKLLAVSSWDQPTVLWDLNSEQKIETIEAKEAREVAFSPVRRAFAYGDTGNTLTIRDLDKWWGLGSTSLHTIPRVDARSDVASIDYSPDGKLIATGHMDSSITIWSVGWLWTSNKHNFFVPNASTHVVRFSPDGSLLATGHQNGTIYLWDASSGKRMVSFKGHSSGVVSLAFHPTGAKLASGGEDGTIIIWE